MVPIFRFFAWRAVIFVIYTYIIDDMTWFSQPWISLKTGQARDNEFRYFFIRKTIRAGVPPLKPIFSPPQGKIFDILRLKNVFSFKIWRFFVKIWKFSENIFETDEKIFAETKIFDFFSFQTKKTLARDCGRDQSVFYLGIMRFQICWNFVSFPCF